MQDEDFFQTLVMEAQQHESIPTSVCWPVSDISLAGALDAAAAGIIHPLLVGPELEMSELAQTLGRSLDCASVINVCSEEEAAAKSVELCRSGHAWALMKGSLHTDLLMHAVLKEDGLRSNRRISHVYIVEAPLYHRRVLLITDAAINICPSLEEKVDIVLNAIDLAHVLGIPNPNVALLSAIETVNPRIRSTLDAAALCKMSDRGQITGAVLDGPLAFDTAVSKEAADSKGLKSPIAGEADILVVPDVESGNMLAKELEYLGGARVAGVVMGATVPVILTSRADSVESRVTSCAIAVLLRYVQLSECQ
jgi:phosphate acetyltransferase